MGDAQTSTTESPEPQRSIGERLRAARERGGYSVAAAAEKLHLDPKVIEALEANRFADLGASVYVRGHLRRYGDFVGEQGQELVEAYGAREARPIPPDLTQIPQAERRADPRRLVSPMIAIGSGLVLLVAIWWVLAGSNRGVDESPAPSVAAEVAAPVSSVPADTAVAAVSTPISQPAVEPAAEPPAAAVPEPVPAPREAPPPARPARLTLQLTNDSWVEVYDSRGERLYYDVASAGSVQSVEGLPPLRVTLGNAAGVAIEVNGRSREIPASAMDGEGARFVVNRSGSLSRAR
jgi:cytoskeleton protein RodZ